MFVQFKKKKLKIKKRQKRGGGALGRPRATRPRPDWGTARPGPYWARHSLARIISMGRAGPGMTGPDHERAMLGDLHA